jgi:hypothetical protein
VEGIGLPKLASLAIRGRIPLLKVINQVGTWLRFDRGDVGKGIVTGMGESDADGVEAEREWIYGDSRVLRPVLGVFHE